MYRDVLFHNQVKEGVQVALKNNSDDSINGESATVML